jgi:uncharacterized protein (TIGR02118 family)
MSYAVNIIYPVHATAPFDLKYYTEKHMPMVQSKWGPKGLLSWNVSQVTSDKFTVVCSMVWKDEASFQTAAKEDAEEIMGDVKNYCSVQPDLLGGNIVSSS